MPDLREFWEDPEEVFRAALDGMHKRLMTAIPVIVTEDSQDGHTVKVQAALKGRVQDKFGNVTHVDYPVLGDVPIHFPQGGGQDSGTQGVIHTYPVKKGDEGFVVFSKMNLDGWHENGGVQPTIDVRLHSLSDAMFVPGHRSNPRKVQNVSTDSSQLRSDDTGKQVVDLHPTEGATIKTVDPNDSSKTPFLSAIKYFASFFHPTKGIRHHAVNSNVIHTIGVDNQNGAYLKTQGTPQQEGNDYPSGVFTEILKELHSVFAHPQNGAYLSANNGQHTVVALNGITHTTTMQHIIKAAQHIIQAPTNIQGTLQAGASNFSSVSAATASFGRSLSMPSGAVGQNELAFGAASLNIGELSGDLTGMLPNVSLSVGAAANNVGELGGDLTGTLPNPTLAAGSAANNVGTVGGDLFGTLPNPNVVSLAHIAGANSLGNFTNDANAATGGVAVGHLYRNGSILMVRVT